MEEGLFWWISLALISFRLCYDFTFTKKIPWFFFFLLLFFLTIQTCIPCSKATAVHKGCVVSLLIPLKKEKKTIDC